MSLFRIDTSPFIVFVELSPSVFFLISWFQLLKAVSFLLQILKEIKIQLYWKNERLLQLYFFTVFIGSVYLDKKLLFNLNIRLGLQLPVINAPCHEQPLHDRSTCSDSFSNAPPRKLHGHCASVQTNDLPHNLIFSQITARFIVLLREITSYGAPINMF